VEDLVRGNPTEVKVVLASVATRLEQQEERREDRGD
jgi:hypothetical protein